MRYHGRPMSLDAQAASPAGAPLNLVYLNAPDVAALALTDD